MRYILKVQESPFPAPNSLQVPYMEVSLSGQ